MSRPEFEEVQSLYDKHRYLDAYHLTKGLWTPETMPSLELEEMILAGRLSWRLGGLKVSRWLFREALSRDADSPLVKYFSRGALRINESLLESLRYFEMNPILVTEDRDLNSSWYATQACAWAQARDFDKAFGLIEKAREIDGNSHWVEVCRAWILLYSDQWREAHDTAMAVWELSAGMPFCAQLLCMTSHRVGSLSSTIELLQPWAEKGQSWEVISAVIHLICAQTEQVGRNNHSDLLDSGRHLTRLFEKTMPLADRFSKKTAAYHNLDLAALAGDRESLKKAAEKEKHEFFQTLARNLEENPDGSESIVKCRRVSQEHNTCLPASVATVLSHFGIDVDYESLVEEVTSCGTHTWRITQWAEKQNLLVKTFRVTPDLAISLIKQDIPFIIMYEGISSGHAMAVIGIDEAAGLTIIHDPASQRLCKILTDSLDQGVAPFGPEGLLLLPKEKADALGLIAEDDSAPMTNWIKSQQHLNTRSRSVSGRSGWDVTIKYPDDPISRRTDIQRTLFSGDIKKAYEKQCELFKDFPENSVALNDLLIIIHRLRNNALAIKVLREFVERGRLPGVSSEKPWRYPPAEYIIQLADSIKNAGDTNLEAECLLMEIARRQDLSGELYHVLGDVLYCQGSFEESLLPYHLGMSLDSHNQHYARAYAETCQKCGREKEALATLRRRVEFHGKEPESSGFWTTSVEIHEDFGYPEKAIELMNEALEKCPDKESLCSFASLFWLRYDRRDLAEKAMEVVSKAENLVLRYSTISRYHHWLGNWSEALDAAVKWEAEDKFSPLAKRQLLLLIPHETNIQKALDTSAKWMSEYPDNEDFEVLYMEELDKMFDSERKIEHLEKMVERNPMDGWAWRELGHELISKLEMDSREGNQKLFDRLAVIVAECERTGPQEYGTLNLSARLAELQKDDDTSFDLYLQALDQAPDSPYCYNALWNIAGRKTKEFKQRTLKLCVEKLTKVVGYLTPASCLASRVAEQLGLEEALKCLEHWGKGKHDDPEIILATAETLYDYGQGISDAKNAVAILEKAIDNFPHNVSLRMSLARGYRIVDRLNDAIAVLEGLLRRCPNHFSARISLARDLRIGGQPDKAIQVIEAGVTMSPATDLLWDALAETLWMTGDYHGTLTVFERAIEKNPESIILHENYIDCLLDMNRQEKSIEVARHLTEVYPDGAYCWQVLGTTMRRCPEHSDYQETIKAFKQALKYNQTLLGPLEELADLHVNRREYDQARQILNKQLPYHSDPFQIRYMIARVHRAEGKEAVQTLEALLVEHPLNPIGWKTLFDWLEDDEDWAMAKRIATMIPNQLLQNPELHAQKLALQKKSGVTSEQLNDQWLRLLGDFPDSVQVSLRRFDDLWSDSHYDEAHKVIEHIHQKDPQNTYVLARLVRSHGERSEKEAAINFTLDIWSMPGEDEYWPIASSWEVLKGKKWQKEAVKRAVELLKDGVRLRSGGFNYIAEYQVRSSAKKARELLQILSNVEWDSDEMMSILLIEMTDCGMRKDLLKYWRGIKDKRDEVSLFVWQALGRALYIFNREQDCVDWMEDWGKRIGPQMWTLSFYLLSLKRLKKDYSRLFDESSQIWSELKHDNTAKITALMIAEGALRTERPKDFLNIMNAAGSYFSDEDDSQWIPDLEGIPAYPYFFSIIVDLLTDDSLSGGAIFKMTWSLCHYKVKNPTWLKGIWFKLIKDRVSFASYCCLRLIC